MVKKNGFSLIEVLVSTVILAVVLPIIYQFLFSIGQSSLNELIETELQEQGKIVMMNIEKDIREARAIFNHEPEHAALLLPDDTIYGAELTINNGTEKTALALMKYTGKVTYGEKVLTSYKVITYYNTFTDENTTANKLYALIRAESKETFIDPAPLTLTERETLIMQGYKLWFPQDSGIKPLLKESVSYTRKTLTRFIVPEGLTFSQKGNNVKTRLILGKFSRGDKLKTKITFSDISSDNFSL